MTDSVTVGSYVQKSIPERFDVFGVQVSAVNTETAVSTIERWIEDSVHTYVCVTGVHGVIESQYDETLRTIHNSSGMTVPDGMPLVWMGRARGYDHVSRVYGPDLMLSVCQVAAKRGYTNYFYGGAPGVPEALAQEMKRRFPGLQVVGTYSPPYRPLTPEEESHLRKEVNRLSPDLFWVGLSTPKQERWMATHLGHLNTKVILGVGAAFDFHTGRLRQAPKWMQRSGLEWFFRIMMEPRRLWRRYLRNNTLFLLLLVRSLLHGQDRSKLRK